MNFNSEQMTRVAISILINEWESLFGSFRGPQVSAGSDKLRAFVTIYDFLITQKYFKTPGRKSCGSKWIGILWQSFHSYRDCWAGLKLMLLTSRKPCHLFCLLKRALAIKFKSLVNLSSNSLSLWSSPITEDANKSFGISSGLINAD